jgi:hypothetical protein
MKPTSLQVALLVLFLGACSERKGSQDSNPAAPHFDVAGSDARAIEVADATMAAMGGRKAWNDARCLQWSFFKPRTHLWDKWTGEYRLAEDKRVVRMNLVSGQGRVFEDGVEVTDPAKVAEQLKHAKSVWINDSYWLIMPYKLKDDGVTLKYVGEQALPDGRAADVIRLTFAGVGDTPLNKYDVWVARDDHLVAQWSYFAEAGNAEPSMTTPWTDWQRYGGIQLSSGRGGDRKLGGIAVLSEPPPELQRNTP